MSCTIIFFKQKQMNKSFNAINKKSNSIVKFNLNDYYNENTKNTNLVDEKNTNLNSKLIEEKNYNESESNLTNNPIFGGNNRNNDYESNNQNNFFNEKSMSFTSNNFNNKSNIYNPFINPNNYDGTYKQKKNESYYDEKRLKNINSNCIKGNNKLNNIENKKQKEKIKGNLELINTQKNTSFNLLNFN